MAIEKFSIGIKTMYLAGHMPYKKIHIALLYLNNYCSEIKVPYEHSVLSELRMCIGDDSDSIYF
jgi:hypothetical protein